MNYQKELAQKLRNKLNSPDYIAMPDLIASKDRSGDLDVVSVTRGGWIEGKNINPAKKGNEAHTIEENELEPNDWKEITNLIEKRNKEKEQLYEQKKSQIKEKLNHTPNLYYRFAADKVDSCSNFSYPDKKGKYFHIWGVENGREYYLNINASHPVLNDFPWEKNGYYLIKTDKKIERNDQFGRPWGDGGENNANNFNKWVEVGDQITITPYEVADKPTKNDKKEIIGNCRKCGVDFESSEICYSWYKTDNKTVILEWFCGKCWQTEEKNYRQKSSQEKLVYKQKPQRGNSDIEHCYYFENGRWVSLESGTSDPNVSLQERKSSCDTCHKKLSREWGGSDNFYIIKRYHGKVNIGGPVIWACPDCYSAKEQEYLRHYETVWERYLDQNNEIDYRQIKFSFIDCYAGKKAVNGKILKQEECSHCQPWRQPQTSQTKPDKETINWLFQYFKANNIKEIKLQEGKLVIVNNNNNNNEVKNQLQINDNSELEDIQNLLKKTKRTSLDYQELDILVNSPTSPSSKSKPDFPYLAVGIIGVLLVLIVVISYRLVKKKAQNK